jgi:serine/threonine protein kinase
VRSDLYSLAVTLHHLLSGEMPPNAVDRVTETTSGEADPLRPLHEINPQIPAVISEVIQRAAALNPNERYATAAEMREALRNTNKTRLNQPDDRQAKTERVSSDENLTFSLPLAQPDLICLRSSIGSGSLVPQYAWSKRLALFGNGEICGLYIPACPDHAIPRYRGCG